MVEEIKKELTPKQKTLIKKPEERQTGKEEPYAYTITDKVFGKFKVLNTANAWWQDERKVKDLIQAYKIDATHKESCAYAGISIKQLEYFNKIHKDFSGIIDACRQMPCLTARKTLVESLDKDPNKALEYLKHKRRDEFSTRTENINTEKSLIDEQEERLKKLEQELREDVKTTTETTKSETKEIYPPSC